MESNLKFLSEKIKKFYFWKWAIPINLLFYLVIFIVQIILLCGFKFYGIIPTNENGKMFAWLIIIQTLAGTISIAATIYTIRLERKFFYFNTISMVLFVFNNIMLGIYVNAFKAFLLWFPLIIRYGRWSERKGQGLANKIPRRLKIRYFFGLLVLYLGLSYGLSLLVQFDHFPILDSVAFVFALGGAGLQMFGYIEGFMIAMVASTMTLTMFFKTQSYTAAISSSIFFISLIGTILAWLAIYHETYGTFKYVKGDKTLVLVNKIFLKYNKK